jgi:hypothetical protein
VVKNVTVNQPGPGWSPYGPYGPYGYPYDPYPFSGMLQGAAAVTNANGEYLNQVQQARLTQSQADQSKLDLQRRINDERRYERQQSIRSQEDERQYARISTLEGSRYGTPGPQIWSGSAPNILLADIQQIQSQSGLRGPTIPLDPGVLQNINVMRPGDVAGVGTLRNGKLQWPFALTDDRFTAERQRINDLAPVVVRYAADGTMDAGRLREMIAAVAALKNGINDAVHDLTPDQYIESMRYANQLGKDVQTLTQPGVQNFFSGKWQARGNTVGELVDYMSREGLRFAPATPGNEGYYTSLHQQLVAYDVNLSSVARR